MLHGAFAPWHIITIMLLILVVFGSKRLPQSARALGQSLRILKAETHELRTETAAPPSTAGRGVPSAVPSGAVAPVPAAGVAAMSTPADVAPVPRFDAYTGLPLAAPGDQQRLS